jgi:hypothetical protein
MITAWVADGRCWRDTSHPGGSERMGLSGDRSRPGRARRPAYDDSLEEPIPSESLVLLNFGFVLLI